MTLARLATGLLALSAFWGLPAAGQAPPERVRTVGFIVLTDTPEEQLARREHPILRPFVEAMRRHGWEEGRNIRYEVRGATCWRGRGRFPS